MILAGDFRKGITVEIDGQVWSIADFQHVKPGKGAAFVRTRLKNVMTGAVLERTFSPTDKYPTAHIETREMQYLYTDGDLYYFMDNESYEQLALNHEQVEDAIDFVVENSNVTIRFYKGNAFSVAAPNFVERRPNPASRVTPRPEPPSPPYSKRVTKLLFPCSLTKAIAFALIPAPVNTWSVAELTALNRLRASA